MKITAIKGVFVYKAVIARAPAFSKWRLVFPPGALSERAAVVGDDESAPATLQFSSSSSQISTRKFCVTTPREEIDREERMEMSGVYV